MTYQEIIAAQDEQRTQRNFISLLGGVLGVDQSMAHEDGSDRNAPGGYQSMAPFGVGGVGLEGRPVSNLQGSVSGGGVSITWPLIALIGGVVYLAMQQG